MKCLGDVLNNSITSGNSGPNGVSKSGPICSSETGGKKEKLWTPFLIRNDFGIVAEKNEAINRLPMFMRMA